MKLLVYVDGAALGNPGPAGIGVVITTEAGEPLVQCGEPIGSTTNNVAEYRALLRALELLQAWEQPLEAVTIRSDSQLLVRQLSGEYAVRLPHLQQLHAAAHAALGQLRAHVCIEHVEREQNRVADRLAKLGARLSALTAAKRLPDDSSSSLGIDTTG